eukprot:6001397-Prymnesium_polylepis.2
MDGRWLRDVQLDDTRHHGPGLHVRRGVRPPGRDVRLRLDRRLLPRHRPQPVDRIEHRDRHAGAARRHGLLR